MTEDRVRMLQGTPILGGVRDDVLRFLLERVDEVVVPEGSFLFEEDDPGTGMYVLEAGEVAILKELDGVFYRLTELRAGDCIGEMSLIDLGRRSASVLAMTECRAIEITHRVVLGLYELDLEQFTLIQMNMARELSRRLRSADERLFRHLIKADQIPRY